MAVRHDRQQGSAVLVAGAVQPAANRGQKTMTPVTMAPPDTTSGLKGMVDRHLTEIATKMKVPVPWQPPAATP